MKIKKTTVSHEAIDRDGKFTYQLAYTVVDGILNNLSCRIDKEEETEMVTPEGIKPVAQTIQAGHISLINSRINMDMSAGEDIARHAAKFVQYVDEINLELEIEKAAGK